MAKWWTTLRRSQNEEDSHVTKIQSISCRLIYWHTSNRTHKDQLNKLIHYAYDINIQDGFLHESSLIFPSLPHSTNLLSFLLYTVYLYVAYFYPSLSPWKNPIVSLFFSLFFLLTHASWSQPEITPPNSHSFHILNSPFYIFLFRSSCSRSNQHYEIVIIRNLFALKKQGNREIFHNSINLLTQDITGYFTYFSRIFQGRFKIFQCT